MVNIQSRDQLETLDAQFLDAQLDDIIKQLTLTEKVALLSGKDNWSTFPIERLGIPSLTMTDGPHGVRANQHESGRLSGAATSFPTGVSMAASWNPELIERVAAALGEETRAMGCDILLGPCVNIVRVPLSGRNFESYSEDPNLAGRIGVAYVKGLQSQSVGASLKHFACNNQEFERGRGNSVVDERTLREIYLTQFEAVVKEAQPWTVMCAYNRINGTYASENYHLLTEILRDEWGFEGVVISDWLATHTITESVKAGLDVEMPGPALYRGRLLSDSVFNWQIEESTIDLAVRRVLHMVLLSAKGSDQLPEGSVNTPDHQALALELAEESITLLKNSNNVLPLNSTLDSIAVIGQNATNAIIGGGGSSFLEPPYRISPLQVLREQIGQRTEIIYEEGCDNFVDIPSLKPVYLRPAKGDGFGLWAEYYPSADFSGMPCIECIDPKVEFWQFVAGAGEEFQSQALSIRWLGTLTVPNSGLYTFKCSNTDTGQIFLNGQLLIESTADPLSPAYPYSQALRQDVFLEADKPYDLRVEYSRLRKGDFAHMRAMMAHTPSNDTRFEGAVNAARNAEVVLIFAGHAEGFETEGTDRKTMNLPGQQDALIEAVAAVNPNTIVVLNTGSPVAMPWVDKVAAIVESYYPGQEGGNAIVNVLMGKVNPSGKLTVTFPHRIEDTPAFNNYPGGRDVVYGEGLFVGYRHYDTRDIEPLFPFGHGLSYTTFAYGLLDVPTQARIGETISFSVEVKNTGERAGKEVIQLYVREKNPVQQRPLKELKSFHKIVLAPNETQWVQFTLDERAFASYFTDRKAWVVTPGEFEILVGSSSRDIRAQTIIKLY